MSSQRYLQSNFVSFFQLILLLTATFFVGGSKAEACATFQWCTGPVCLYGICSDVDGVDVSAGCIPNAQVDAWIQEYGYPGYSSGCYTSCDGGGDSGISCIGIGNYTGGTYSYTVDRCGGGVNYDFSGCTTSCGAVINYSEGNATAIANYCGACSAGQNQPSSISCHAGSDWTTFGASCTAPYCDGCGCTSPPACSGSAPCGSPGSCYAKSGCDSTCGSTAVTDCAGRCGGSATDYNGGAAGCGFPACSGSSPCGSPGSCYAVSGCDSTCGSTAVTDCAGRCGGSATDYNGATAGCGLPACVPVENVGTPVSCNQDLTSFGVPASNTVGSASWTQNSCTDAITYTGGCSAPAACSGSAPCGSPGSCYAKSGCDSTCGSTAVTDCAGRCGGSATDYNGATAGCGYPACSGSAPCGSPGACYAKSGCDNVCDSTATDYNGGAAGCGYPACSGSTPCGSPGACYAKSGCDNVCDSTATDYNGATAGCGFPDSCGTANGTPQLSSDPSESAACEYGAYSNSPADITTAGSQAWRWSCGSASCSSPKYGCTITTDSNYTLPQYGASGPSNTWGCASTCANGATNYSACTVFPTCTLPWGSTINNDVWVYAFNVAQVISPASCTGTNREQRTCTNGTLNGSYTNSNCQVLVPSITSFTVAPTRVRQGNGTVVTIKWSTTNITSCSIKKNDSVLLPNAGTSSIGTTDTVTAETTYTITCDSLPSQSVTVNVVPGYEEF